MSRTRLKGAGLVFFQVGHFADNAYIHIIWARSTMCEAWGYCCREAPVILKTRPTDFYCDSVCAPKHIRMTGTCISIFNILNQGLVKQCFARESKDWVSHEINNMKLSQSIELKQKLKHRLMTYRKNKSTSKMNYCQNWCSSLDDHCTSSLWFSNA